MATNPNSNHKYVIETRDLDIFYGSFKAVTGVNMKVERHKITAIIGPSGCGKSTLLRAFNRMNELYAGTSIKGQVMFDGEDIYASQVDPVEVRYRIGMVERLTIKTPGQGLHEITDEVAKVVTKSSAETWT